MDVYGDSMIIEADGEKMALQVIRWPVKFGG
jgi:hypothetical protein